MTGVAGLGQAFFIWDRVYQPWSSNETKLMTYTLSQHHLHHLIFSSYASINNIKVRAHLQKQTNNCFCNFVKKRFYTCAMNVIKKFWYNLKRMQGRGCITNRYSILFQLISVWYHNDLKNLIGEEWEFYFFIC